MNLSLSLNLNNSAFDFLSELTLTKKHRLVGNMSIVPIIDNLETYNVKYFWISDYLALGTDWIWECLDNYGCSNRMKYLCCHNHDGGLCMQIWSYYWVFPFYILYVFGVLKTITASSTQALPTYIILCKHTYWINK